ncbi:HAMP domain-containing sensor histidine kinase [Aureibacillus halotolerans]|uniref:Sensor histidine kinase n=1 Tax=Aureibacillus halotolerans TaxID=1508390 RepID=A0A4R6U2B2_9BACI|nr:sensor histidine kinase [Aureibacillus halotolerans]TDQ40480.1 NarL family two-component system sensor histidine kinase LiaS [Aureibacillus halotolerans]
MQQQRKLSNTQWKFVRFGAWISGAVSFIAILVLTLLRELTWTWWVQETFIGIPISFLMILGCSFIGAMSGYILGNLFKKRIELFSQSILDLERGNFTKLIPDLGDDEFGEMAKQLNAMASRIEAQIASLQKLSNERAEWSDGMKQKAVNEERQRLARELHDAVSQQLFAISMMSSALQQTIADDSPAQKQIEAVERMAGTAQSEMRALLLHLRPAHLEGKGLVEGLEELLMELHSKQEVDIEWHMGSPSHIPKGVEDHLFRVSQEALSNILRHSQASKILFKVTTVQKQLRIEIADNGIGFNVEQQRTSSYGLKTMQERIIEVGGVLEIHSLPNKGTTIHIKVPLLAQKGE